MGTRADNVAAKTEDVVFSERDLEDLVKFVIENEGEKWYVLKDRVVTGLKKGRGLKKGTKDAAGLSVRVFRQKSFAGIERLVADKGNEILEQCEAFFVSKWKLLDGEYKWMKQATTSGTMSDRIDSLSTLISSNALLHVKEMGMLLSSCEKSNIHESVPGVLSARELFIEQLLPSDRKLEMISNMLKDGLWLGVKKSGVHTLTCSPTCLLFWALEQKVKVFYLQLLQTLKSWMNKMDHLKNKSLHVTYECICTRPEQETFLLDMLVNGLGMLPSTCASKARQYLINLLHLHPGMSVEIYKCLEQYIWRFRDSTSDHWGKSKTVKKRQKRYVQRILDKGQTHVRREKLSSEVPVRSIRNALMVMKSINYKLLKNSELIVLFRKLLDILQSMITPRTKRDKIFNPSYIKHHGSNAPSITGIAFLSSSASITKLTLQTLNKIIKSINAETLCKEIKLSSNRDEEAENVMLTKKLFSLAFSAPIWSVKIAALDLLFHLMSSLKTLSPTFVANLYSQTKKFDFIQNSQQTTAVSLISNCGKAGDVQTTLAFYRRGLQLSMHVRSPKPIQSLLSNLAMDLTKTGSRRRGLAKHLQVRTEEDSDNQEHQKVPVPDTETFPSEENISEDEIMLNIVKRKCRRRMSEDLPCSKRQKQASDSFDGDSEAVGPNLIESTMQTRFEDLRTLANETKDTYDPNEYNPNLAMADTAALWELSLLRASAADSVSLLAHKFSWQ